MMNTLPRNQEHDREPSRTRQRTEVANRARASFIAALSHEIRNPLNAIMAAGYLLDGTELTPEQQQIVKLLRSSSAALLNLVNNILDLSRIESGQERLEEKSFDLPGLARDILVGLQGQAAAKGLTLESRIDERIPAVLMGDPVRISQILTNLLSNAVKFTDEGTITLSLRLVERRADRATIEFRVRDTGIGIAPERLPHVFDDFFMQAADETSGSHGGAGLGLAICKRLVEMHGSRLTVESEPGRGSTFRFTLRLRIGREDD